MAITLIVPIVCCFVPQAERVGISGYDFEMFAYPVTFRYDESIVK